MPAEHLYLLVLWLKRPLSVSRFSFVGIIKHLAAPYGELFIESVGPPSLPIIDQLKKERNFSEIVKNMMKKKKESQTKPTRVAQVAVAKKEKLLAQGTTISIPEAAVVPRVAGRSQPAVDLSKGITKEVVAKLFMENDISFIPFMLMHYVIVFQITNGAIISIGLVTRIACLVQIPNVLGALYFNIFKWKKPFKGGWQLDLTLLASSIVIIALGGGLWALFP